MFFRKLPILAGLFLAFCLFSPSAHAQFSDIQDAGSDACGGGGGWEPTPDGGPNPPTTLTCSAFAGQGQQCRTCSTQDPPSQTTTATCGWTKSGGACKCTPTSGGCTTEGSCHYYP